MINIISKRVLSGDDYLVSKTGYLPAFEGWKGIGITLVLFYHFYVFFFPYQLLPFGYMGVDMLFILSGVLLCRQYELKIATHQLSIKQFAIRRAARLFPLYAISILLFVWVNEHYIKLSNYPEKVIDYGSGPYLVWNIFLQLYMLTGIGGMVMPWNGPAWVVSVSWLTGLLYFILVWEFRRVPTFLWAFTAIFVTMCLMQHHPQQLNLTSSEVPLLNGPMARGLVGMSIGVLIYRFHYVLPPLTAFTLRLLEMFLIAVVLLIVRYYHLEFIFGLDYVFLLVVFPLLIVLCLYKDSWLRKLAAFAPFAWLGHISYPIFLLHMPLGYAWQFSPLVTEFNLARPAYGLAYLAFVLAVSLAAHLLIERPLRNWGYRKTA